MLEPTVRYEAHRIRNRSSQVFQAVTRITATYRWCLTGTPIHNSLDDYGTLLSFLGVTPFNDKSRFDYWIARPLKNGERDSLARLRTLVRATCLRRTKKSIGDSCKLPARTEKVHEVYLCHKDRELYEFFRERCSNLAAGGSQVAKTGPRRKDERKEGNILALINFLRLICDHGEQILPAPALEAWIARDRTAIDLSMIQACQVKCCACDTYIEESDAGASSGHQYLCQHSACFPCASRNGNIDAEQAQPCPKCRVSRTVRVDSYNPNCSGATVWPSSKVEALLKNLRAEQADGWTSQGPTPTSVKRIDLKVANHVHLMEPQWNPMVEAQAVDRVHRIGQEREVWITRYIVRDSIETYIQWVQEDKLRLVEKSLDSLDESQTDIDSRRWKKLQTILSSRNPTKI
ncbi:hypothetical protein LTR41_009043 [Exophiala xenobiotica]|nr:hypothetical protein LTR41_009043 [Exophiala xenobiotica]